MHYTSHSSPPSQQSVAIEWIPWYPYQITPFVWCVSADHSSQAGRREEQTQLVLLIVNCDGILEMLDWCLSMINSWTQAAGSRWATTRIEWFSSLIYRFITVMLPCFWSIRSTVSPVWPLDRFFLLYNARVWIKKIINFTLIEIILFPIPNHYNKRRIQQTTHSTQVEELSTRSCKIVLYDLVWS